MSTFTNPRRQAAMASLEAAFGSRPAPTTRPLSVVTDGPGSRRLVLSVARG